MTKNSQIKGAKLVIFKNTTNKKYMVYFTHYEKCVILLKKSVHQNILIYIYSSTLNHSCTACEGTSDKYENRIIT